MLLSFSNQQKSRTQRNANDPGTDKTEKEVNQKTGKNLIADMVANKIICRDPEQEQRIAKIKEAKAENEKKREVMQVKNYPIFHKIVRSPWIWNWVTILIS